MWTMWMLGALALAQDGAVVGEAEAVVVPETSVGFETPVSVSFRLEGDVSVSAVELTNVQGTAFRFAGANELGPADGAGWASVELVYAPTSEGRHQAEIAIVSDAECTAPAKVLVRGSAYEPCVVALPKVVDFGPVPVTDSDVIAITLQSCDGRTHTVDTTYVSNARFTLAAPPSFEVGPTPTNLTVQFTAIDTDPQQAELLVGAWETPVQLLANDCYGGNPANFDSDGDGVSDCGIPTGGSWEDADGDGVAVIQGDCNDTDPDVYPGAEEVDGGGDEDCDGKTDEHLDLDGDNGKIPDDCDDTEAWVGIGEPEVYDGLDNDCDGEIDDGRELPSCAPADGEGTAEGGCGCDTGTPPAGGAWLGLLALVGLRRRR